MTDESSPALPVITWDLDGNLYRALGSDTCDIICSMGIRLSGFSSCAASLLVLFGPALLVAYLSHSLIWLIVVPFVIILLALLVAAIPSKRKLTPEQFADKLEKHLLGTEGPWDWDDTTSVAIANPRLEEVRSRLSPNLDSLSHEKDKDELRAIIAALRRGELPGVTVSPRRVSLFRLRK